MILWIITLASFLASSAEAAHHLNDTCIDLKFEDLEDQFEQIFGFTQGFGCQILCGDMLQGVSSLFDGHGGQPQWDYVAAVIEQYMESDGGQGVLLDLVFVLHHHFHLVGHSAH